PRAVTPRRLITAANVFIEYPPYDMNRTRARLAHGGGIDRKDPLRAGADRVGGGGERDGARAARRGERIKPEGHEGAAAREPVAYPRDSRHCLATRCEHRDRRGAAVDGGGEHDGARRAQRGPEAEVGEDAAARDRIAEPG